MGPGSNVNNDESGSFPMCLDLDLVTFEMEHRGVDTTVIFFFLSGPTSIGQWLLGGSAKYLVGSRAIEAFQAPPTTCVPAMQHDTMMESLRAKTTEAITALMKTRVSSPSMISIDSSRTEVPRDKVRDQKEK